MTNKIMNQFAGIEGKSLNLQHLRTMFFVELFSLLNKSFMSSWLKETPFLNKVNYAADQYISVIVMFF